MTDPTTPQTSGLGGRLATKAAEVVSQAYVSTKGQLAGHTAGVAQHVLAEFTNHVSDEIRSVMGDVWKGIAEHETTPEQLRPLFRSLASERGQAWAWIGGSITSAAIGGGLIDLINNELAPLTHTLIAANPHGLLSPADAANAQVRGIRNGVDTEFDMAAQGFDTNRQAVLRDLAENQVPPDWVIELMRRKVITKDEARGVLLRHGYNVTNANRLLALREVPLTPGDAAAGWARNLLSEERTNEVGEASGFTAETMSVLRGLAGEPPAIDELLLAWRRGVITEKDVDRGIIQGPLRNEWIPAIKALQWLPLSVGEAADAVNQGHLTLDQALQAARESGVRPEDFQVIVDNAGIPPGPQEALDWVNRGLITDMDFRTIFLESRVKNKYIDLYLQSRTETMPPETVRLMYARGAMTKEDALHRLQIRGYTPEDAAIILQGATAEKTQQTRDLTQAQIRELYAERAMTAEQAAGMLAALGFDTEEIAWILDMADFARVRKFQTAAINRVHAAYSKGLLDDNGAAALLDNLGMPAEQRDDALALWNIERGMAAKTLTLAQTQSALKKGLIQESEFISRVIGLGYDSDDAELLRRLTVG